MDINDFDKSSVDKSSFSGNMIPYMSSPITSRSPVELRHLDLGLILNLVKNVNDVLVCSRPRRVKTLFHSRILYHPKENINSFIFLSTSIAFFVHLFTRISADATTPTFMVSTVSKDQ